MPIARLRKGKRAIGNGDKKVMAVVVFRSDFSGIAVTYAALIVLPTATLIDKTAYPRGPSGRMRGRNSHRSIRIGNGVIA